MVSHGVTKRGRISRFPFLTSTCQLSMAGLRVTRTVRRSSAIRLVGQPTPGNIDGGLSTIEEKSLGCIYKAGTKPLQDVIDYAMPVRKKGLVWMVTPGHDIEQLTGMVAGGCHIVVFTTGRGTCCGSPIAPTIKVATNTEMYEKMKDNMDMNAGAILTGTESVREVGERIFAELLHVASGKLTRAEALGFNDFAIWRIGPSM